MSLHTMAEALLALLHDEIEGKSRLANGLERQERALVAGPPAAIDAATRVVEVELAREMDRARRRDAIFKRLAAHWNVSPGALTLASVAERLGAHTERLATLRAELRAAIAVVLRRNRRVARLVSVQSSLVNETVAALLGSSSVNPEPGALFEARG